MMQALLDSSRQKAEKEVQRKNGDDLAPLPVVEANEEHLPSLSKEVHDALSMVKSTSPKVGRQAEEMEARERRRLVREERQKYHLDMRKAENLLQDDHPHRAMDAADSALYHYRKEESLEGFQGRAARGKSEAWKLLHRTIKVN
jgi:hypothetical protein